MSKWLGGGFRGPLGKVAVWIGITFVAASISPLGFAGVPSGLGGLGGVESLCEGVAVGIGGAVSATFGVAVGGVSELPAAACAAGTPP